MISKIGSLAGKLLVLCLLLSSWTISQAAESTVNPNDYELTGHILDLNNRTINVDDMSFGISPTVKVKTKSKEKASLMDLKIGTYVGVITIRYNGRILADTIHYLPNPPDNE